MPELTTTQRDALQGSDFAYVDRDGGRHLPVNDEEHVRNAVARFDQTDFSTDIARHAAASRIVAAAKRFGIELDPDDAVMREFDR